MIEFIYGVPSSGKTTLLYGKIRQRLKEGADAVLIVPDQEALDAEAALVKFCRGIPTVKLRVYGFSRLADDVFRRYGGVCYDTVDGTGRTLAMFLAGSARLRQSIAVGRLAAFVAYRRRVRASPSGNHAGAARGGGGDCFVQASVG